MAQQEMTVKEEFEVLEGLLDKITDDQMKNEAQRMVMDRAQSFQWRKTAMGANREDSQMCISAGRAFGLDAFTSLNCFDVIQGRVTMRASLRSALTEKAGWHWIFVAHDDKMCSLIATKESKVYAGMDGKPHVFTYTMDDAKKAGLDKKDNWQKNPMDMLFARCITRLQRRVCPSATLGMDIADSTEPFTIESVIDATEQRIADKSASKADELRERLAKAQAEPVAQEVGK